MKKKLFIIFSIILLTLFFLTLYFFCYYKKTKDNNIKSINSIISISKKRKENNAIYYELESSYIYAYNNIDSIMFTYDDETKELSEWFKEKKYFMDIFKNEIINASEYTIINPNDNITSEYHIGNISIVFCGFRNSNIIIGENLNYKTAKCPETEKKIKYDKIENDEISDIYDTNSYYGNDANCVNIDNMKPFYEDETYKYYTGNCESIFVMYKSGFEESLMDAFKSNSITLYDLDLYDYKYKKIKK